MGADFGLSQFEGIDTEPDYAAANFRGPARLGQQSRVVTRCATSLGFDAPPGTCRHLRISNIAIAGRRSGTQTRQDGCPTFTDS